MKRWLGVLLMVIVAGGVLARPAQIERPRSLIMTGMEDLPPVLNIHPENSERRGLDDPIGQQFLMGTSYYDYQQNGTMGKQIAVDRIGRIHAVWTNLTDRSNRLDARHVFYNVWEPAEEMFVLPVPENPVGVRVDNGYRAGFCGVSVDDAGFAYPVYHQTTSASDVPNSAAAIDYEAAIGAFTAAEIPHVGESQIIWPHVVCDVNGNLHTVHTESGGSSLDYYARGVPVFVDETGDHIEWPVGFEEWEPANFITIDIAASFHTPKIAVAWINNPPDHFGGNNIYVRTSDDAGQTWNPVINVTDYFPIDTNCVNVGGDARICNGDTLRPWIDLSVIVDENDVTHVAFTTTGWYYWWPEDNSVGPWMLTARPSQIWHWDEQRREYNIMAERWYGVPGSLGVNNLMCHRPNLAVDSINGILYCSYQLYDTSQYSQNSHLQADAWVTVSGDHGRTWSAGTNVTRTDGGQNTPSPECMTEIDINLARFVTGGFIHMQYCLDHDAGSAVIGTPVGEVTLNQMYYLRIPVDSIPRRPFINPYRNLRVDSTGYPWDLDTLSVSPRQTALKATDFRLYANYPNPFNASTRIQFDLPAEMAVTVKVFDVLGREVAALVDDQRLSAGAYVLDFAANDLPSGIYLCRLSTPRGSQSQKMVLVR